MGSDCDDAGAQALLHAYADLDKVDILACVYSSGKVQYGAGVVEAINRYYGRPDIPVGAYHLTDVGDSVDKMLAAELVTSGRFGNEIVHNTDAPEMTRLLRGVLARQPDQSVVYITVGHTKGLYDLLRSPADDISGLSGEQLVKTKIEKWVALGALRADNEDGEYRKDWNFFFNGTALYTDYLVDHFPTPVFYISAGNDVLTGKSLENTPRSNIVREAYVSWLGNYFGKTLSDQRPSWDLAAVYYAVEGDGDFLKTLGKGNLDFDPEKGCRWMTDSESSQYYVTQKEGVIEEFADYLNQMISRPPRNRP